MESCASLFFLSKQNQALPRRGVARKLVIVIIHGVALFLKITNEVGHLDTSLVNDGAAYYLYGCRIFTAAEQAKAVYFPHLLFRPVVIAAITSPFDLVVIVNYNIFIRDTFGNLEF